MAGSRDSGTGPNWGHVAINAPFAWGCVTGAEAGVVLPRLAVVDIGIHDAGDLRPNLGNVQEFASWADPAQHGTEIASIIGAVGNNQNGVTGMLWKANLNLYDAERRVFGNRVTHGLWESNVVRAAKDSSRVVNISWGEDVSRFGSRNTLDDSLNLWIAADAKMKAVEATRDPATGQLRTLFVISAGNDTVDTYWSGWGYVKRDPRYKNNIIIVGATQKTGNSLGMLVGTSGGADVDVMAPGDNIGVDTSPTLGSDVPAQVSGTSFAAPFVVGVAGMLLANDPSLTPDSLKRLIILGAQVKPRPIGDPYDPAHPKPFLDAYESLRLLSTNRGAPLCGNHVYSNNDTIVASRASSPEVIGALPPYARYINAKHGGRRIEVYGGGSANAYTRSPTGWQQAPIPNYSFSPSLDDGGSYNGSFEYNHDADSVVQMIHFGDSLRIDISDTTNWGYVHVRPAFAFHHPSPGIFSWDCDWRSLVPGTGYTCGANNYLREVPKSGTLRWGPYMALAASNDGMYFAVGYTSGGEVTASISFVNCYHVNPMAPDSTSQCLGTRTYRDDVDSMQIFRANRKLGVVEYLASKVGALPKRMAVSEDDAQLLLTYAEYPQGMVSTSTTFGQNYVVSTNLDPIAVCTTVSYAIVPPGPSGGGTSLGAMTVLSVGQPSIVCGAVIPSTTIPTVAPYRGGVATAPSPLGAPKPLRQLPRRPMSH